MSLHTRIQKVLFTAEEIAGRVSLLAAEISADFGPEHEPPALVGVATGGFFFLADLMRRIDLPITVDFVRAESYASGTESNGAPRVSLHLKLDVTDKHVILVEDIVDTGNTLSCLIEHLKSKGASSVSVCTFLDKPTRRKVHFKLVGKGKFYRGFKVFLYVYRTWNFMWAVSYLIYRPSDLIISPPKLKMLKRQAVERQNQQTETPKP